MPQQKFIHFNNINFDNFKSKVKNHFDVACIDVQIVHQQTKHSGTVNLHTMYIGEKHVASWCKKYGAIHLN